MSNGSAQRRAETALPETSRLDAEFLSDVLEGLSGSPKTLPCRWLYDERGSELFEEITRLPEYYPTRTEQAILETAAPEIAREIGSRAEIVEYGSGASVKTRTLLDALDQPRVYRPMDISEEFLLAAAKGLAGDYPTLRVEPFVGDFLSGGPEARPEDDQAVLGFFPGSTIGNLADEEILDFLTATRQRLGRGAYFLLGADLAKSPDVLIPAYDDAAGVTAAFNLNLLARINRELDGNFDLEAFRHEARWNAEQSRVEMHLVSGEKQEARVAGERFEFAAGETIHTENSRKFTFAALASLLERAGWRMASRWTDEQDWFAVALARAA